MTANTEEEANTAHQREPMSAGANGGLVSARLRSSLLVSACLRSSPLVSAGGGRSFLVLTGGGLEDFVFVLIEQIISHAFGEMQRFFPDD